MRGLALLAMVVSVPAACMPAPATARAPSRLMVSGDEYRLVLSRQRIARGPSLVQFVNRGEDAHDLKMRRIAGGPEIAFPKIASESLIEKRVNLNPPGRYRIWCSLSGHARLGMRATLTVRG